MIGPRCEWGQIDEPAERDIRPKRSSPVMSARAMLGGLLHARAGERLRAHGISYTELDVLATLRRSGAPYRLSPTVLRKAVLLTSGAMTACLNRLEQRGLIRRSPMTAIAGR